MNERLKLETLGFADTGWDWEGRTFPGRRGSRVSQKRGSKWDLKTEISEIEWTLGEGTKKMGWVREAAMGDTLSSANLSDQGCSSGFGSSYTASSEGNAIVTHCVFGKERWIQHGRRTEENFLPFCRALTKTELRGISPLVHPIQDRQTHTQSINRHGDHQAGRQQRTLFETVDNEAEFPILPYQGLISPLFKTGP